MVIYIYMCLRACVCVCVRVCEWGKHFCFVIRCMACLEAFQGQNCAFSTIFVLVLSCNSSAKEPRENGSNSRGGGFECE